MEENKEKIAVSKIELDKDLTPKIVEVSQKQSVKEYEPKREETSEKRGENSIGSQLNMKDLFPEQDRQIEKRQKILKRVLTIGFFALVIGVLAYTFWKDFFKGGTEKLSWKTISATINSTWFYILFAIIALSLCFVFKGFKLSLLCKYTTNRWHFGVCMQTGIIGHYYNYVTPLAVGGQPFEIYHLSKHGVDSGAATSLAIATYFMHQLAFVVLGAVSLILFSVNAFDIGTNFRELSSAITILFVLAWIGLFFAFIMPVMIVTFCLHPKFGSKVVTAIIRLGGRFKIVKDVNDTTEKTIQSLNNTAKALKEIFTSPLIFMSSFIIGVLEHLALCSIAYFTLKFFGFDLAPNPNGILEWVQIVEISMILYAAVSFIPTPGNSGAADLSFYTMFESTLLAGLSFTAMIFWRILSYYSFIIIGFIFTTQRKNRKTN